MGTVALDGQKAYYVAPGGLVAWDLAGDEEIGTLKAEASSWPHHPEHDGTYKTIPHSPGLGTVEGSEISAYDRAGKRLWRVGGPSDDSGRMRMTLRSAFHGVVYATSTSCAPRADPAPGRDRT